MKIQNIKFAGDMSQAWLILYSNSGDYLGIFHTNHQTFIKYLREVVPTKIEFDKKEKL
jgi:hypothetical protein